MEDRTDSLSRLTTLIMVSTGVAMEKGAVSQDSGTIILACNSLGIALVYVYTLGPLRVVTSLVAYAKVQRNAAAWADRDADSIAKLTDVEIVGMSTAHLETASSSQLCLVYARAVDIEMDLSQLNIVVIPMWVCVRAVASSRKHSSGPALNKKRHASRSPGGASCAPWGAPIGG